MFGKRILLFITTLLFVFTIYYTVRFYPNQSCEIPIKLTISTPEPLIYNNDCLHPCIRFTESGINGHKWWMIQSPFYDRNSDVENPILYYSDDKEFPSNWTPTKIIAQTPLKGFNSDPNLFIYNDELWVFWREFMTPLCDSLGVSKVTVGVYSKDGLSFSKPKVYLTHKDIDSDSEQAPVLIHKNNKFQFYSTNYQYSPTRTNTGIAIWEGSSLHKPDFKLTKVIQSTDTYVCDRITQLRVGSFLFFIPKPLKHDIWHFDLFEFNKQIFMFSVSEWGDNIMLGVEKANGKFKTFSLPLVNNHYLEKFTKKRVYFYKPTGYIKNDTIFVYYTATSTIDGKRNDLFKTKVALSEYFNLKEFKTIYND